MIYAKDSKGPYVAYDDKSTKHYYDPDDVNSRRAAKELAKQPDKPKTRKSKK